MRTIGVVIVVAFASASAEAKNPLSDFCRAVVAEGPSGAMSVKYPQEAQICAYQRDNGLPEFGNLDNATCEHMASLIKASLVGKPTQFVEGGAEWMVYTLCIKNGAIANNGGIVWTQAAPEVKVNPADRPVVDSEAMKARMDALVKAQADLYVARGNALKGSQEAKTAISELAGPYVGPGKHVRSDEPDEPVRPPTWPEGVGITAGTGVIGAIGGSGISALAGGAVLTTGLLTGGIGLGVGALGVIIWKSMSDDESAAIPEVPATASTVAASP